MSPDQRPSMPPPDLDEVDIDIDIATADLAEASEYLGDFESVDAYLRAMLEPEITPGVAWLLDCLDTRRVLARFESDGSQLCVVHGTVFRTPRAPP